MSQPQTQPVINQSKKPWAQRGQPYRGGLVPVRIPSGDPYANDASTTK